MEATLAKSVLLGSTVLEGNIISLVGTLLLGHCRCQALVNIQVLTPQTFVGKISSEQGLYIRKYLNWWLLSGRDNVTTYTHALL